MCRPRAPHLAHTALLANDGTLLPKCFPSQFADHVIADKSLTLLINSDCQYVFHRDVPISPMAASLVLSYL
jgi:hypothetical protein